MQSEGEAAYHLLRSRHVHDTVSGVKAGLTTSDPEILSGTPVLTGTRVPVKNLTDCLEGGDSIDEILDDFSSVSRTQLVQFLEEARVQLTAAVAKTRSS